MHRATIVLLLGLLPSFAPSPAWASFHAFEIALETDNPGIADGRLSAAPVLEAFQLNGEHIRVDGRLDDEAWDRPQAAAGFRIWDPDRGAEVSEQTVFKIAYDQDALYVGVACFENDASRISSQLCRRDRIHDSDVISLYVDPYHDRTTGYNFRVNPAGVIADHYVFDDGNRDPDWDAVWHAEAFVDDQGWYAEMRIPFACMRYKPGETMTWGLQLYRYMHGRGEDTAWVIWDRETRGFVSRFGELTGLQGVPPARQVELLPYAVVRATDASVAGDDRIDNSHNLGLDLKYGVTANLTLNATVQPDFGQVEADPAVLNLSPFETFYDEKRPFFIEGSRFFSPPSFRVFYSRRIGTGSELSRIRFAGKLTGKTRKGFSIAALYASTDVTERGQSHNLFKRGEQQTHYLVGRFGKEFNKGQHRVNFMQTAVYRSADRDTYGDSDSRDAWTSAFDFSMNLHDRTYNIEGSFVGSIIDPAASASDPSLVHDRIYGTGGTLDARKLGGTWLGGVWSRWETERLDLNDAGFLSAPDEVGLGGWLNYQLHPKSSSSIFRNGHAEVNLHRMWLYGPGAGSDRDTGEIAWAYEKGHPQSLGFNLNFHAQTRSCWNLSAGGSWNGDGTSRYETRSLEDERGPLMTRPRSASAWYGFNSDYRKRFTFSVESDHWWNRVGSREFHPEVGAGWNATSTVRFSLNLGYARSLSDAEHLDNFANPRGGIGGVSYVFAELDRRTVDLTFRANLLFGRNLSLELYTQPYQSVGDYHNARELAQADSYDLRTASGIPDFSPGDVDDYDFRYSSVNVNAVLRWEYRPGSTFYLVWKQGRDLYAERIDASASGQAFNNDLRLGGMFDAEPENVILAKINYWFAL